MKKRKGLLPWYIYLIPFVLAILIMNSGVFQKYMTAVEVGETAYKVNEYNFYYFTQYYHYINSEEYDSEVFNVSKSAKTQDYYEEDYTWADYFGDLALEQILECEALAILCPDLDAGLEMEIDARVAEHRSVTDSFMLENDLDEETYFTAYYGNSMTAEIYYTHYRKLASAEVYRENLIESLKSELSEEEIQAWIDENWTGVDYETASYVAVYLEPEADRHTGTVGEEQWADLDERVSRLCALYEEDPTAERLSELAVAYSDELRYVGDTSYSTDNVGAVETKGVWTNAIRESTPDELESWLFGGREPGDFTTIKTNGGVWVIRYTSAGQAASRDAAENALARAGYESMLEEVKAGFTVETHGVGLHFAG